MAAMRGTVLVASGKVMKEGSETVVGGDTAVAAADRDTLDTVGT
jgi:hypothetical protein